MPPADHSTPAACGAALPTPRTAIRAILNDEAAKAGIAAADILGRRRSLRVSAARHAAIRRARAAFPLKRTTEIARLFGLHPTTVLYALGLLKRQRRARGLHV